jgi:hypothetical protein
MSLEGEEWHLLHLVGKGKAHSEINILETF